MEHPMMYGMEVWEAALTDAAKDARIATEEAHNEDCPNKALLDSTTASLDAAKRGWDSCIADLRKAAEICREVEAQVRQWKQHAVDYHSETRQCERTGVEVGMVAR